MTPLGIKKSAFTLIELLLAVFILEIGLLGIAGFYAYSATITRTARNETTAANLASGLLDEESAKSYDALTVGAPATPTPYSTATPNPFANFQKLIDISYLDSNLNASYTQTEANQNMKKITVTIYWTEVSSQKNYQIATIKAKH